MINTCKNGYGSVIEDVTHCKITGCNCTYVSDWEGTQCICNNYVDAHGSDVHPDVHKLRGLA